MKLIPAISVLASMANADLISLVKTLESQMKNTTENGVQMRNFDNIWDGMAGILATMTEQITGSGDYGCWCYFAENNGYVGNGYGAALDNYDRACKALHDNYACMEIDDATCDPFTVSYNVPDNWIATIPTTDDFSTSCNAENPNSVCAASACIAESSFVKTYFVEKDSLNADYQHTNINFDISTSCSMGNSFTSWTANRGDKACCGDYPNKQIFFDGTKSCCGGLNVYNTVTKQCCEDQIKNVGDYCPIQCEFNCDFESGICPCWEQRTDDSFDWTVHQGSTGSVETGPTYDHSQGNGDGKYLYVETSSPVATGDNAVLTSPRNTVNDGRTFCLSFWYHMYGNTMGKLTVSYGLFNDAGTISELFMKDGDQGDTWQHSMVELVPGEDFNLLFDAVRGDSWLSDIAIDDIELFEEACDVVQGRKLTIQPQELSRPRSQSSLSETEEEE